jgi:short-subunit dehydrogenase
MAMELRHRVVLVTGASSGIGAETAQVIGAKGNRVILLARRERLLRQVADQVRHSGGQADAFTVDLADAEAVDHVAAQIKAEIGIPDIIINNAGLGKWLTLAETTPEETQQMLALPFLAAVYMTRAFVKEMTVRGSGHIVNLTSDASFLPKGNALAYSAARYALRGFSEALRADLVDTGVSVSLAVFGKVASTYWENNPGSEERIPAPTPFMPTLTTRQVADALIDLIENNRRIIIKPAVFKLLFWAFGRWPDRVARSMKRQAGCKRRNRLKEGPT